MEELDPFFSQIALHDILPEDHLKCWQLYISACRIYCSSVLTLRDIDAVDELIKSLSIAAKSLYGSSSNLPQPGWSLTSLQAKLKCLQSSML